MLAYVLTAALAQSRKRNVSCWLSGFAAEGCIAGWSTG
jgi:hypothetical protein